MIKETKRSKTKPPKTATQKKIKLPPFIHETEGIGEPPKPFSKAERVGFAIAGLGHLSIGNLKKIKLKLPSVLIFAVSYLQFPKSTNGDQ